jgi:hypothetical protein
MLFGEIMSSGSLSLTGGLYKVFKYSVYALLTLNIFLFFQEESLAIQQTFSQGIDLGDIIQGYAATIDTAAWVLLLLLFEFETSVLRPRTLARPDIRVSFSLVRVFSYGFIGYAFYGYFTKMLFINGISPFVVDDVCRLVGQGFSIIDTLDQYPMLAAENCGTLNSQALFQLNEQNIIGHADQWSAIQWLALADVINSFTWIAVVIVLEVDVRLQQQNRFKGRVVLVSKNIKFVLYAILLGAATYWGFLGDLLDFWDAFMWLLAFFFIEVNIFKVEKSASLDQ